MPARIFDDTVVGPKEEQAYSLLLIGGPDANLESRRLAARLPFQAGPGRVAVDGRSCVTGDAALQAIYPSPCNPERFVEVVFATSTRGLSLWSATFDPETAIPAWDVFDWVIWDGAPIAKTTAPNHPGTGWVAAGVFDARWRQDDRWTTLPAPEEGRSPQPIAIKSP